MDDTKKRSRQRDLVILGVIFLGIVIYYLWPNSVEAQIKKQLKRLAEVCSITKQASVIQTALASEQLHRFFQGNALVEIASPASVRIEGLADIKSKYLISRKFLKSLNLGFSDILIKKLETERAVVSCTATFSGSSSSGEKFNEFQEMEVHFQYSDKLWKITLLKQVKSIE